MSNTPIFFAKGNSPEMISAFEEAQKTFKYCWRELSWDYRRIVTAVDLACVKVAFSQDIEGNDELIVEHMWINEIDFDGEMITGVLVNDPNELTNITVGDSVEIPISQISDWLLSVQDCTYGGFSIHAIRADMSVEERNDHDEAWGLNFGDFNEILVVNNQKTKPENLIEHPMCINMRESFVEYAQQNPQLLDSKDEFGYTLLHRETIAGNRAIVEVLLQNGVDKTIQTNTGKTALDFAKLLNWEHIIPVLSE